MRLTQGELFQRKLSALDELRIVTKTIQCGPYSSGRASLLRPLHAFIVWVRCYVIAIITEVLPSNICERPARISLSLNMQRTTSHSFGYSLDRSAT